MKEDMLSNFKNIYIIYNIRLYVNTTKGEKSMSHTYIFMHLNSYTKDQNYATNGDLSVLLSINLLFHYFSETTLIYHLCNL